MGIPWPLPSYRAVGGGRATRPFPWVMDSYGATPAMGSELLSPLLLEHQPPQTHGQQHSLAALPFLSPVHGTHALDEFAEGAHRGCSSPVLVLRLLPPMWQPKLLQAELVEALQAPHHDGSVGLHPAEQGAIIRSVLSPAVCPKGR